MYQNYPLALTVEVQVVPSIVPINIQGCESSDLIWFQTCLHFTKPHFQTLIPVWMHWKAHLFRHFRIFQSFSHKCFHTPEYISDILPFWECLKERLIHNSLNLYAVENIQRLNGPSLTLDWFIALNTMCSVGCNRSCLYLLKIIVISE